MACPVAGANHSSVYGATWRWELSENGLTVGVFGAIKHPGEERRSLAKRGATSLGHQKSVPLSSREVLLKEWQDSALFVLKVVAKGAPQVDEPRTGRHVG